MNLAVLNAVLNGCLYLVHGIIALLIQQIYVLCAQIQIATTGCTRATDSSETKFLHWMGRMWRNRQDQRSPGFVFALFIAMLLLFPAELLLESGIDVNKKCDVVLEKSENGVCASPWGGWSAARRGAMALLVFRFQWDDENWDFVQEGASKNMWSNEVHSLERSNALRKGGIRFLAKNCDVKIEGCKDCGKLFAAFTNGPFGTTIVNSTWLKNRIPDGYCEGDAVYEGTFGAAFMFCADSLRVPVDGANPGTSRVAVKGIETSLSKRDEELLLQFRKSPWPVYLMDNNTRTYDVSCDTDGITRIDFTQAISVMRTIQMEMSGENRSRVSHSVHRIEPLNASDVVKSVFAIKAEDPLSTCTGEVEVYNECAIFKWERGFFFAGLTSLLIVIWAAIKLLSIRYQYVEVPYDSVTWRKYACKQVLSRCLKSAKENENEEVVVALENPARSRDYLSGKDDLRRESRRRFSSGLGRNGQGSRRTTTVELGVEVHQGSGEISSAVYLTNLTAREVDEESHEPRLEDADDFRVNPS